MPSSETAPKDWNAELARLEACLAKSPGHTRAPAWQRAKAGALRRLGRFAEAEETLHRLVEAHGETADDLSRIALLVQRAGRAAEAASLWADCIASFPHHPAINSWRQSHALSLAASGDEGQAETILSQLAAAHPDDPHGLAGLAQLAELRRDWRRTASLWQECIATFPEPRPGWRRSLAIALERIDSWRDAYRAWDAVVTAFPDDRPARVAQARCLVRWKGPTEDAARLVAALADAFPQDVAVCALQAWFARESQDPHTALDLFVRCCSLSQGAMRHLRAAMDMATRTADICVARRILEMAATPERQSTAYRCTLVLPYLRLTADTASGLALIDGLADDELDAACARAVASFLHLSAEYTRLAAFCRSLRRRFPADPVLARLHLMALYHAEGEAAFRTEKECYLDSLTDAEAVRFLRSLELAWLSPAELIQIIDDAFGRIDERPLDLALLRRIGMRGDGATLDHLARCAHAQGGLADEPALSALLARVHDLRLLAVANLGNLSWADFAHASRATARLFTDALAQQGQAARPSPASAPAASLCGLLEAQPQAWINSHECFHDAAQCAHWLTGRIRARQPTSLIRLGDGEGNFLGYALEDTAFQAADQQAIQRVWWGSPRLDAPSTPRLMDMFATCVAEADGLGVPPPRRLLADLAGLDDGRQQRGLRAVLEHLGTVAPDRIRGKILTSAHIHTDLHGWDLYRQIFAVLSDVSVISCHDLSRALAERFGLAVRQWLRVPPEHAFAGLFADAPDAPEPPFYPDIFEAMLATLTVQPGEVFLVAAGFLGKLLCGQIRRQGGIAIDIGSAADLWMNHVTRRATGEQIDLDIAACLVAGQPFEDHFQAASLLPDGPCRSDRARRRNLAGRFDRLFDGDLPPADARYRLRIIGHPRCGSAYTAHAMQALGLEIGHERPLRDGICSWIHAVDDRAPPYSAPVIPAGRFAATLGYVRDPLDALPSIMLENCAGESFSFRRFHLARLLGLDIAGYPTALARAVAAYLGWMEIVRRQAPLCVLRVEHLAADIDGHAAMLYEAGFDVDRQRLSMIGALPKTLNASRGKVAHAKPVLPREAYQQLPAELQTGLLKFCDRFGYEMPF